MFLSYSQLTHPPTHSHPLSLSMPQVLESNLNQLETKGVQLAANKEQLQTISLQLEGRQETIKSLQKYIAEMEQQIASSLKGLLLNSSPSVPSSPPPSSSSSSPISSKVGLLSLP